MRNRVSSGEVKKGLALGSLLHFRMEETSGDVLTDDVAGVIYTRVNIGTLNYNTPNAVSHLTVPNGGTDGAAGGKSLLTNLSAKIQGLTAANKTIILYSCANYHNVTSATPSDGSLCAVTDFSDGGSFFLEFIDNHMGIAGRGDTTAPDFVTKNDTGINPSDTDPYSMVVKVQFGKSPAFTVFDNAGNKIIVDDRTVPSSEPYIMQSWDLTKALTMSLGNCQCFMQGMLYLEDVPSDDDCYEAAKWHAINAPQGQKDVWPGWNNYKAG